MARQVDPKLAQRYQRLMCESGKHHNSATCSVAAVLLTRIAACLRTNTPYEIRDLDGRVITADEGRKIVRTRCQVPREARLARRALTPADKGGERTAEGVARRSGEAPPPLHHDSQIET